MWDWPAVLVPASVLGGGERAVLEARALERGVHDSKPPAFTENFRIKAKRFAGNRPQDIDT